MAMSRENALKAKFVWWAGGIAFIVALLGNVERLVEFVERGFKIVEGRTAAILVNVPFTRDYLAGRAASNTYDDLACFGSSDAVALDGDGILNDFQVGFYYPESTCSEEPTGRISYAYYVYTFSYYEYPFARISAPGNCEGLLNITEWTNFFGAYRLATSPIETGAESPAHNEIKAVIKCYPKVSIQIKADGGSSYNGSTNP